MMIMMDDVEARLSAILAQWPTYNSLPWIGEEERNDIPDIIGVDFIDTPQAVLSMPDFGYEPMVRAIVENGGVRLIGRAKIEVDWVTAQYPGKYVYTIDGSKTA